MRCRCRPGRRRQCQFNRSTLRTPTGPQKPATTPATDTDWPAETFATATDTDWPAETIATTPAADTDWPAPTGTADTAYTDWPAPTQGTAPTADTDWPAETVGTAPTADTDWSVPSDDAVDALAFAFTQPAAHPADAGLAPNQPDDEREWNTQYPELPAGVTLLPRVGPDDNYISARPGDPLLVQRRSSLEMWAPELGPDQRPTPAREPATGAAVPDDGWGAPLDVVADDRPLAVLIKQGKATRSDVSDGIARPQLRREV